MKKTNVFKLSALAFVVTLASCQKDVSKHQDTASSIPMEIKEKLSAMGLARPSEIEKVVRKNDQGVATEYYLIQKDVLMTADQILNGEKHQAQASNSDATPQTEQYRTYYGIYPKRTICIGTIKGGPNGLDGNQVQGLIKAVQRYNNLGLGLKFKLTIGGARNQNEIIVQNDNTMAPGAGVAGFPTYGKPHPDIFLGSGIKTLELNAATTMIAHEIGHCIGMRHTDWFDRYSCNPNQLVNEGQDWMGAVHIPNTTTWRDYNSTMSACYNVPGQTGFSHWDIEALRWWYN